MQLRSAEIELKLATGALDAFAKKRKTSLEVADIKVKTAEDVVNENRTALERLSIKAPPDGVVYRPYVPLNYTRAKAEPGRVCRAGDKLLELPDLSAFEAILWVRPRDAARIQIGDVARVTIVSLGEQVILAKVAKKDGFATTRNERYGTKTRRGTSSEISITLELAEQPEGMRPGGTVRAEIDSVLKSEAVLLPLWALSDERNGKGFVTLASGERRQVEIGLGARPTARSSRALRRRGPGDRRGRERQRRPRRRTRPPAAERGGASPREGEPADGSAPRADQPRARPPAATILRHARSSATSTVLRPLSWASARTSRDVAEPIDERPAIEAHHARADAVDHGARRSEDVGHEQDAAPRQDRGHLARGERVVGRAAHGPRAHGRWRHRR